MARTCTKKGLKIDQKELVDPATGQIIPVNVIAERDTDFNFEKIWLSHLLDALNVVGGKKIAVLNYLLSKRNSKNQIIATQRRIASDLNIALRTVQITMKSLQDIHALKLVQQGVYMLNPDIVFKGGNSRRMNILLQYENVEEHDQKPALTE